MNTKFVYKIDFRKISCPPDTKLVFCDPPYGIGKNYDNFNDNTPFYFWVRTIQKWARNVPWIIIIGPYPNMHEWLGRLYDYDPPHRILMWHRTFTLPGRKIKGWTYSLSPIIVFRNEDAKWYGPELPDRDMHDCIDAHSMMGDVSRIKKVFKDKMKPKHPATTGTFLPAKIILYVTQKDDLVVDPMVGMGGILVAAARLNRRIYGCDISNEYVNAANHWINWEIKNLE